MKALLMRLKDDGVQTLGHWIVFDGTEKVFECRALELPWKSNMQNLSCIPKGEYEVELSYSQKFGRELFEVKNITGRSGIRIHRANYFSQLQGCIAVGSAFSDINADGYLDVIESKITEEQLMKILPSTFTLTIV